MDVTHSSEMQLKGVGGWLLFLILSLTIFGPLTTVHNLVTGYEQSSRYFDRFPALLTIEWVDILLSTAFVCLSVYAGVLLWRIQPNAVKTAKSVLKLVIAYYFIVIVVAALAGLPAGMTGFIIGNLMVGLIRAAIFVAIWHSYLKKSKRVQATYFNSGY
jgi:hypothetical protein